MELYITFAICFLPLILGTVIAVLQLKELKWFYAFGAIGIGFIAIVLIIIIQYVVKNTISFSATSLAGVLVSALLFNGLIEESVKMGVLFFLPGKKLSCKAFFVASFIVGCSVGSLEAVMYVVTGTGSTVLRLFTAVLLHALCTGLAGLSVWSFKNGKRSISPFITAVVCHGVYNYFAGFTGVLWWFSIATIVFTLMRCRLSYMALTENTDLNSIPE